MQLGSVRWYNAGQGHGIIDADDGSVVFLPFHAIEGDGTERFQLKEQQRVAFDVEQSDTNFEGLTDGLRAKHVHPVA